jgi:homopolymeric O-antigen transport system permease protein
MERERPVVVYEPEQRVRMGFFACWSLMVRNLIGSRELIWQLFKRDFFSSYKQYVLGLGWIFIAPIVGILSWVFMNYAGVLNPGDVEVPYPVYVLFGTTIWGLFMGFYGAAAASLISDSSLLLQVNFPREALVAQQMAQTVIGMIANMVLLFLVLALFGFWPDWKAVFFPMTVMPLFFLGSGVGMLVAVLAVVVRDVSKLVAAGLGLLMFVTPVIYAPGFKNEVLQAIIWWNPLTYLVGGARDIVLHGRIDHPSGYAWAALFSMLVFLLSWRLFFLSEQKVAEKA